jgi:phenylalanyl-tRNA synthetase beta chain
MLASYNWIKEFVDVEVSPEELADKLTMAGLEIEGVKHLGRGLESVFTAKILKVARHPNADRLSLCEVQCGKEVVSVVCGASNMKQGDVVALAKPGASLPNGVQIKVSKIRQVESHGMLCSEVELGLAESSNGIMILPPDTVDGKPLLQVLPVSDTIFEINVTPNRGDCLSMRGLAREVAANYHRPFKEKSPAIKEEKLKTQVSAAISDEKLCLRYTCRVLQGVKLGPSPQWMARRLESCGIRSINNIVDATNYVMLETGQPLHAFDLRQIHGGKIEVRRAKDDEMMKTLDGQERRLQKDDLVIADRDRVLALAGVMGGEDSGIVDGITDLLLESAAFSSNTVRKTSRRLALATESSYRFERGVDPNGCKAALDRLTEVIQAVAGGGHAGPATDAYPHTILPQEITLHPEEIRRVLGVAISAHEIHPSLEGLGIHVTAEKGEAYCCKVPTYRSDLTREIDLIEEVARLYGYDRIPVTYPKISLNDLTSKSFNPFHALTQLRTLLTGWGFTEVLHYSFTSPPWLERFGFKTLPAVQLLNPISEELSVMRSALFPQMLQTIQTNFFKGARELKLFELRPVYHFSGQEGRPYQEQWRLCLAMAGARRPLHFLEKDEVAPLEELRGLTLLDLKGYLKSLVEQQLRSGIPLHEVPLNRPYFHPKRQLQLGLNQGILGEMGQIHPQWMVELDLKAPVVLAEISLDLFLTELKNSIQFQEISPFPTVWRDLNLIVEEATPSARVLEAVQQGGGPFLRQAQLYDVYRGKPLEEGKWALTYRLEYGAMDRTLTDDEVNAAREKLLKELNQKVRATLR